jgi:hypothetical protein
MNFAYLDARSLLESVLSTPPVEPVEAVPCTLDQNWTDLGKTLSNFKHEYAKVRVDLSSKLAELAEKKEEVNILKMMLDNVASEDLKERLVTMIDDYEKEQDLDGLQHECGELTGRSQAMKKVLQDTDAERYAKFTCFVCMDRLVDLFIEPCGHVICEPCWARTQNKVTCPGCRTRLNGAKRIFTLS